MKVPIEKLLVLQDKDANLDAVWKILHAFPGEITALKAEISAVQRKLDNAKSECLTLEVKRSSMRAERRAVESKIAKYKTQLSETKKNDDYIALNAEIERMTQTASDMEGAEIQVLFDIDSKKDALKILDAQTESEIASLREKIEQTNATRQTNESLLENAKASYAEIEAANDPAYLAAYKRLRGAGKKLPLVVPVMGDACGGCHLKLSGETLGKVDRDDKPVCCDQCGRILYTQ